MMERRRALTIPFTADKDKLMEKNPLKIPMTCLSSEYGKLEQQVPWTAIAGCKFKSRKSQHKNGPVMFDHSHAALKSNQMTGRKLRLILTDVLKTKMGKDYMEKVKRRSFPRSRGRLKHPPKEIGESREEPQICRSTRLSNKEANNNNTTNNRSKCLTPKSSLKTSPPSSQRTRVKKRLNSQKEDKEERQKITELIEGKEGKKEEKIVEDCELSLSLKPTVKATSCDEMSSDRIKNKSAVPEKQEQQSLKRKKKYGSQCNGRSSSKRRRKRALHLSGENGGHVSSSEENGVDGGKAFFPEDGIDGGQDPASVSQGESENDVDLENMDRCIVQFTVGGDDGMDALVPVITPNLEAECIVGNNRWSSSSRLDCTTQTSPFEPIVLSSDEEDGNGSSHGSREVVHADTVIQEAVSKQEEVPDSQDIQMLQVLVEESPPSAPASPIPEVDISGLSVPFCALHCGDYKARANGGLMIVKSKIIIPLQDANEQQKENLSFDRKELRRYSIWDQQELETWGVQLECFEEPFSVVLLFYVSETAAAAIQQDLSWLCIKEDGSINTGKASPFILLTLRDPLEGMEGALLRSVLDLDCINSMAHEQIISAQGEDKHGSSVNFDAPVLSFDDAIELIRGTGLDSNLLSLLGIKSTDFEPMMDQDSSSYDADEISTAHIWLHTDFQKESDLELETEAEEDTETKIEPKEDQTEEEVEKSPDSIKEKAQPVYTVCHGRTKGSYSVSLSKPDSSWIKYKHQGLARRLIQFPPPPLKGGITVTMEDLQCLDSGQYLNDVIIDFYLKYLIQNTPAAIAERCHIFSSFFYKQLTRRDNASEGGKSDSCQRQRRYQRVKTWTRHVDIFKKDFLFVPVNQESHWYLVVVCFAGLEKPESEDWTGETDGQDESQHSKSSNDDAETPATVKSSDNMDSETGTEESTKDPPPRPVNCTEMTCQRKTVCKRPCILVMDSLKLSLHERVFKLLREYLESEWESRRGSVRDFGSDGIKNSYCKVPLQDNSSDCGLYLLQYVECFLKDPVVHFDLPLLLQQWFPRQLVRNKRDRIRDLILNLYRHQNLENKQK